MNKKISVLIRTYNSKSTVRKAIQSVLQQTLSKRYYQIVVIDDGSTDDTLKILSEFEKEIYFIKSKHIGAINTLNLGLEEMQGEYYTILDSDDYLPRNALESLLGGFSDSKVAVVMGDYYEIERESLKRHYYSTKKNIFLSLAGGLLIKKDIAKKNGFYDDKLFFPEYDLLIKILQQFKIVHIPEIVYYYCRQVGSLTTDKNKVENGLRQLEEKYGEKIPIRKY